MMATRNNYHKMIASLSEHLRIWKKECEQYSTDPTSTYFYMCNTALEHHKKVYDIMRAVAVEYNGLRVTHSLEDTETDYIFSLIRQCMSRASVLFKPREFTVGRQYISFDKENGVVDVNKGFPAVVKSLMHAEVNRIVQRKNSKSKGQKSLMSKKEKKIFKSLMDDINLVDENITDDRYLGFNL